MIRTALILATICAATPALAAEADAGESKIFPILDSQYFLPQLFWLGVTFLLLYFLLSRLFLPAVGETLEARSSRIADDLDSANRMQREAEEAEEIYTRSLNDARAKAATVAEATRDSVNAEVEAQMEAADADAARAALVAEERIRDIRAEAMSHLDTAARDTADAIVGKLVPART